jgi:hypothetical protein
MGFVLETLQTLYFTVVDCFLEAMHYSWRVAFPALSRYSFVLSTHTTADSIIIATVAFASVSTHENFRQVADLRPAPAPLYTASRLRERDTAAPTCIGGHKTKDATSYDRRIGEDDRHK